MKMRGIHSHIWKEISCLAGDQSRLSHPCARAAVSKLVPSCDLILHTPNSLSSPSSFLHYYLSAVTFLFLSPGSP